MIPKGFTDPFRYIPHPLVTKAAGLVMHRVSSLEECLRKGFEDGKMLGVLVVNIPSGVSDFTDWLDEDKRIGFLCAFSGAVAGRGVVEGFVPPIFDLCEPGGYYRSHESEISGLNRRIACMEGSSELAGLQAELTDAERSRDEEIGLLKARMAISKRERDEIRSELSDQSRLAELVRESQFEKAELHRLKMSWSERISEIQGRLNAMLSEIRELKQHRAALSDELQKWIFEQYIVHDALGGTSTIWDIFTRQGLMPPGGTGDCAAPKLLNHAFINGFEPVAMGEFWYGKSPETAVRVHGHFYPSCTSKCGPILKFMMTGLFRKSGLEKLNPSHDKSWAPPVHEATGGHGFSRPPFRNSLKEQHLEVQGNDGAEPVVIYEDEWIAVVVKPAGMPSVPGLDGRISVLEWLNSDERRSIFDQPVIYEAVHRLDMDTSGIMVYAKSAEAAVNLRRQFEMHIVRKTYMARLAPETCITDSGFKLPEGVLPLKDGEKGRIEIPLSPDYDERPRQKADRVHGKEAITEYEVAAVNPDGTTDLVFHPFTGRTHQLRVHSAHPAGLGRPILGDLLYGGYSIYSDPSAGQEAEPAHIPDSRWITPAYKASRLHLHALSITFRHPSSGEEVCFSSHVHCYR